MEPSASRIHPRNGSSHKRDQDDPFPLISDSQTPLTDISSSDSDSEPAQNDGKPRKTSRARAKKERKAAHHNQPVKPSLRPAADILSRIRHDPALGGESEYVIGYLDRHEKNPLEMDVGEWKGGVGDVTDEEFIPQHRILYFRKKGDPDGRKVWERATRLDHIFGSGISKEEKADEIVNDQRSGGNDQIEDVAD